MIICPLLTTIAGDRFYTTECRIYDIRTVPCRRDSCAWWVEDKQKCAVAALGGKK